MIKFSRKKLRGFPRKIKQLENWKNFILTYPLSKINSKAPIVFRIHLQPFFWFKSKNPSIKFHQYLYEAFAEIYIKFKNDEQIIARKLAIQLWLNYPRTIKSTISIGSKEQNDQRNEKIDAKLPNSNHPKLLDKHFQGKISKIGTDTNFSYKIANDGRIVRTPHKKGDIWIVN